MIGLLLALMSDKSLHRNIVESKVQYLFFKCSEVKVSYKMNIPVKYRYLGKARVSS